jgi:hypothetical protein
MRPVRAALLRHENELPRIGDFVYLFCNALERRAGGHWRRKNALPCDIKEPERMFDLFTSLGARSAGRSRP